MSATAERPIDHGERIYILLDDSPMIVSREDLYRAVNLDVVYACPYGWTLDYDVGRPWPCGHSHSGPDFYHLAPGKTWDDYHRAVAGLD